MDDQNQVVPPAEPTEPVAPATETPAPETTSEEVDAPANPEATS